MRDQLPRRFRPGLAALAGLLATLASPAGPALADGANTILILDGSGSMAGRIDGRTKAEIARETVTTVLDGLPEGRSVGLMAYGHRVKGDCGDIELIVPPGPGTVPAIRKAVAGMKFIGKTPLTEAVRRAAGELRYTEEKATVILVTDGIESCDADPCALARELEQGGVGFTAHVVGFGLSQKDGAAVACLAEETGGRYLAANDAAGLAAALTEAIAEAPPEPPADHFPGRELMPGVALEPTGRSFGPTAPAPAQPAFSADGTAPQCQALCAADNTCGSWQFEPPGSHFIAEPRCRLFGRDAEMDYSLTPPEDGWISGIRPGVTPLVRPLSRADTAPLPVVLTAGGLADGVAVSWSAVPLDGQAGEAVALPDAITGPWETSLEPGRWTITGQAVDGARFEAEITVAPEAGTVIIPQVFETAGMGEDTAAAPAHPAAPSSDTPSETAAAMPATGAAQAAGLALVCTAPVACRVQDATTGLEFLLGSGFGATELFHLETATGVKAARPSVEIYRLDALATGPMVALNPRQWPADLGPCMDSPAGAFCVRTESDARVIALWAGNLSSGLPKLP